MSEPCWLSVYLICNVGLLMKETSGIFHYFGTDHCLKYLTHSLHASKESPNKYFKIEYFEQNGKKYLEFSAGSGFCTGSFSINNTNDEEFIANSEFVTSYGIWLTELFKAIRLHKILLRIHKCMTEELGFKWKDSSGCWRYGHRGHGYYFNICLFYPHAPYWPRNDPTPDRSFFSINRSPDPEGEAWPVRLAPFLSIMGVLYPTLSEFMPAFRQWAIYSLHVDQLAEKLMELTPDCKYKSFSFSIRPNKQLIISF
jgi:hypothetical protein